MAITRVGCSGAEFGLSGTIPSTLGWTVSGNPTTSAVNKRTGSYGFDFHPVSVGTAYISHIPVAGERTWTERVYIMFTALPSLDYDILKVLSSVGTHSTVQFNNTNSRFAVGVASNPTSLFGPTIVINTWYCVEFVVDRSGATASCWARVDQGTIVQSTLVEAATDIASVRLGDGSTAHNDGINGFYADDWEYAKCSAPPEWIGAGGVVLMVPTSVGTHSLGTETFRKATNETTPAATTLTAGETDSYTYIDEWPYITGTSGDWIDHTVGTGGVAYAEWGLTQNALPAGATPNVAKAFCVLRNDSGTLTNASQVRLIDGVTTYTVFTGSIASATPVIKNLNALTPASQTALNGMKARFGFVTDTSPVPRLLSLGMEVSYADAAAAARIPRNSAINHQNPAVLMEKLGAKWEKAKDRIWLPNFGSAGVPVSV